MHLRRAGLSAEIIASGSPRKRFDRALKKGASEVLVLTMADGALVSRLKPGTRADVAALVSETIGR